MANPRLKLFYTYLKPFSAGRRRERLARFIDEIAPREGEKVIDLGGLFDAWNHVPVPLDITVVNLAGTMGKPPADSHHRFTGVEADACDLPMFEDGRFDIAFSNSVIEHVGPPERQQAFAREVRRLGRRYWVQTPSIWFPLEAHTGMPFWWFYPRATRERLIARWHGRIPAWADMIAGTTVIRRSELAEMFPDGRIWTERFLGFAKSYVVMRS